MARRGGSLSRVRRAMYYGQRTIGDYQAAQSGRLVKRLVRRSLVRALFRVAK